MTNSADLASCESADIKRRILELIEGASSIAISGHTSPDGDALGSVLGLGLSLMKVFPDKDIALLLADDDPVPRIYRFMEGADLLVPASAYTGNPDLFISVDVPVVERLNNSAEVLRRSAHVACFDHHPAREEFAEVSLRCVNAAACAMIIDRFLADCGITASDSIATCLLCGLDFLGAGLDHRGELLADHGDVSVLQGGGSGLSGNLHIGEMTHQFLGGHAELFGQGGHTDFCHMTSPTLSGTLGA